MATPEMHECAVRRKETTRRCAGCKISFFCSRDCQKLVWDTHKWFCGKDSEVFTLPPLNKEELAEFNQLKDRPYRKSQAGLSAYFKMPSWEVLLGCLANPPLYPLEEGQRTLITLHARLHLETCRGADKPSSTPWQSAIEQLATILETCMLYYSTKPGGRERLLLPLHELNPFFRQFILFHHLCWLVKRNPPGSDMYEHAKACWYKALEKLGESIELCACDERIKEHYLRLNYKDLVDNIASPKKKKEQSARKDGADNE